MKIGFSLSKCVKDIVDGVVDEDDVLVIITGTNFDLTNDEQWTELWHGYSNHGTFNHPIWIDLDHEKVYAVVSNLWLTGKIHQPRQFGSSGPHHAQHHWLDTGPTYRELNRAPEAVQKAWDDYKLLTVLTQTEIK